MLIFRNAFVLLLLMTLSAVPAFAAEAASVGENPAAPASSTSAREDAPAPVLSGDSAPTAAPAPAQGDVFVLAHPARVSLGQAFALRITSGRPLGDVVVAWQGKEIRPSVGEWNGKFVAVALLGTDVLRSRPGAAELRVSCLVDGERREFTRPVAVLAKKYPEQRLTVEEKMVTPPASENERLVKERAAVAEALASAGPQRLWALPLLRPVSSTVVTSPYGYRRILNGKPKNPHRGLDLRAPVGEPVHACADGVVVLTGDHYYAGKSVYVDHGNGVVSMYFHLSALKVTMGQTVRRGDVVGLAGATGRATGPHLHFGLALDGLMVDPQPLLSSDVDELLR